MTTNAAMVELYLIAMRHHDTLETFTEWRARMERSWGKEKRQSR
jgi:hypothetical protein